MLRAAQFIGSSACQPQHLRAWPSLDGEAWRSGLERIHGPPNPLCRPPGMPAGVAISGSHTSAPKRSQLPRFRLIYWLRSWANQSLTLFSHSLRALHLHVGARPKRAFADCHRSWVNPTLANIFSVRSPILSGSLSPLQLRWHRSQSLQSPAGLPHCWQEQPPGSLVKAQ